MAVKNIAETNTESAQDLPQLHDCAEGVGKMTMIDFDSAGQVICAYCRQRVELSSLRITKVPDLKSE